MFLTQWPRYSILVFFFKRLDVSCGESYGHGASQAICDTVYWDNASKNVDIFQHGEDDRQDVAYYLTVTELTHFTCQLWETPLLKMFQLYPIIEDFIGIFVFFQAEDLFNQDQFRINAEINAKINFHFYLNMFLSDI